jgi:hypothetical protein
LCCLSFYFWLLITSLVSLNFSCEHFSVNMQFI